ncbi:MAG TPA: hypothetical protein VF862_09870 [Gemmatimonadales bacterium]
MRRPTLAILALTVLAACTASTERTAAQQPMTPAVARRTGWLGNWLKETSGLAISRAHPGVLWSHNDSGGDAVLFATDSTGADRGRFTVMGVENRDWEDLALGPCPEGMCLYIAETGDNPENNRSAAIYRIPEPDPARPGLVRGVERLVFRYADRPRDVEAIFVAPDSSVHLISKGVRSEIAHYRLPASAWLTEGTAVAERLPMPSLAPGARRLVTGATMAADGATVMLLTYRDLWRLSLAPDGALVPKGPLVPCDVSRLLPQTEAVAWLGEGDAVLLSSEAGRGQRAQLMVARCPWPR